MAVGIHHKYNARKLRLMNAFVQNGNEPMTCRELSEATGIDKATIVDGMKHFMKLKRHYFRRLPNKVKGNNSGGAYRYKITDYGLSIYMQLLKRAKVGVDLNLHRATPNKMPHFKFEAVDMKQALSEGFTDEEIINYIGITKRGVEELGLLNDDISLLKAAGLMK